MREHADYIERLLERHAADEPMVTLHLTDDGCLCSYNGSRLELGIPLPPMQRQPSTEKRRRRSRRH